LGTWEVDLEIGFWGLEGRWMEKRKMKLRDEFEKLLKGEGFKTLGHGILR
jgi:hypothetical protein